MYIRDNDNNVIRIEYEYDVEGPEYLKFKELEAKYASDWFISKENEDE